MEIRQRRKTGVYAKRIDDDTPLFVVVEGSERDIRLWLSHMFPIRETVHLDFGYKNDEARCILEAWEMLLDNPPAVFLVFPKQPLNRKLVPGQVTVKVPSIEAGYLLHILKRVTND